MTDAGLPFAAAIDLESRRNRVRGVAGLDGIDFVEVVSNHAGTPGHIPGAPQQKTLVVHLLNGPVPEEWDADNVHIIGGVRDDPAVNPVRVEWAHPASAVLAVAPATRPDAVDEFDAALVAAAIETQDERERAFVVRTSSSGDWSTYTLRLAGPGGVDAPDGIDLPLSSAPFWFTVDCPADFDCEVCRPRAPVPEDLQPGDYLARDYEALRTRLLDRLSALLPEWNDRNAADPAVMLAELFAAVGDRLAYWQDAVAVEAYLGTARRRMSVRRHARLLGYPVHEGTSARTLLAFTVAAGTSLLLRPRLPVTDLPPLPNSDVETARDAAARGGTVFETCDPVRLTEARNAIDLYAWGDVDHCLPAGSTAAFLATDAAVDPALHTGDLLVLVDRPPDGVPRDGDPARRFPVRLIADARRLPDPLDPSIAVWEVRWGAADALRGPLPVTTPDSTAAQAVALANVVLADHGASIPDEPLTPPTVRPEGPYRPRLQRAGLAYVDPVHGDTASVSNAAALLSPDPARARAAVELDDGERIWHAAADLVADSRLDARFVVEPEPGGIARLRFGDGVNGRAPSVGVSPRATYRVGGGAHGNVAPDSLTRILARPGETSVPADIDVWNPIAATGGTDPEPVEQVRQLAPAAIRTQRRAVTSRDYAVVAEQNPGTQRAVARRRWTGSWYAQEVTVDAVAARSGDESLAVEVRGALEARRMAGMDVELGRPVFVPLELIVGGCVEPGYAPADVESRLRERFSSGIGPEGQRGFFHPDRFTFGQSLPLSDVVAAAMAVDGLAWVELTRFARADSTDAQADAGLSSGVLRIRPRELLRCDSDPSNPEFGRIEFQLGGGDD